MYRMFLGVCVVGLMAMNGCEGEPIGSGVDQTRDPDHLFEYESKPVGDDSALPYRPNQPAQIEIPAEPMPAPRHGGAVSPGIQR